MPIRLFAVVLACFAFGCVAASAPVAPAPTTASPSTTTTNEPLRVFEAAGRTVIVDAARRIVLFDGAPLEGATQAVGAAEFGGRLFIAQRDAAVLVYDLPAPETDGPPTLVQRVEHLGRELSDIIAVPEGDRVLALAAGSTEVFGISVHEQKLLDDGSVDEPAYVDHARFFEFLRDEHGDTAVPRLLALGPQSLALVTDREILELFHLDRSYRVLGRTPLPEGVARVEGLVYTGSRWILAGLDTRAEPVLLITEKLGPWKGVEELMRDAERKAAGESGGAEAEGDAADPDTEPSVWTDLGVATLDAALEIDGQPIAWLPARFTFSEPGS
ncbi:MAG: hypothetical protein ACIAQU_11015, partial [Phycisphaerales bacterium JB064]